MSEQFEQDDREVLLRAVAKRVHNREVGVFAGHDDFGTCASCEESVTAVLAAGFRRSPEPQQVTDEMVERAAVVMAEVTGEPRVGRFERTMTLALLKAALGGGDHESEYTPTTVQVEVSDEAVQVFWYEHDCEWLSKYCDEHHRRSALVPRSALGGGE